MNRKPRNELPPAAAPNKITGTKSNDALIGTALDDLFAGWAGDDSLTGLDGNDILNGGPGADSMQGDSGNDIFIVDDEGDTVHEDPGEGTDTVRAWVDFSLAAHSENLEILTLFGANDIAGTGNERNNRLTGNSGANLLVGLGGNDKINGGLGADTMKGGAGNDLYLVDNLGDKIVEMAGEGSDTVRSSVSFSLRDQSRNLENLTLLGKGDIDGTGNSLDNVLRGNSGANILIGGDGNDRLIGNGGADDMRGGAGDDIYVVDDAGDMVSEGRSGGYDIVRTNVYFSLAEHSKQLEALTFLGRNDVNGVGNDKNNIIRGNSGANWVQGNGGNDRVFGNGGSDTLNENEGDDFFNGGSGTDRVFFSGDISGYDIRLTSDSGGSRKYRITDTDLSDGDSGSDRFVNVERAIFRDAQVFLDGRNHAPVLGDDSLVTDEDTVLRFGNTLERNDFDPDDFLPRSGDITLKQTTLDTTGTMGTVSLGSVISPASYDPNGKFDWLAAGETATDTFKYTVDDGYGGVSTATVRVTIEGRDDPEIAVGKSLKDQTAEKLSISADGTVDVVYRLLLAELLTKSTGDASDILSRVELMDDLGVDHGNTAKTKLGATARIVGDEVVLTYHMSHLRAHGDGQFGDSFRLGYKDPTGGTFSLDFVSFGFTAADVLIGNIGDPLPSQVFLNGRTGGRGEKGVIPLPDYGKPGRDGDDGADASVLGGNGSIALNGSNADELLVGLDTPDAGRGGAGGDAGDGGDGYIRWLQTRAGPVPSGKAGFSGGDGGDGSDGGDFVYAIRAGGGNDIIVGGTMGLGGRDGLSGEVGRYGEDAKVKDLIGTTVIGKGGSPGLAGEGGKGGDSKYLIDGGSGDDTIYAAKLPVVADNDDAPRGTTLYEIDGGAGNDNIYFHQRYVTKEGFERAKESFGNYEIRGGAGDDVIQRIMNETLEINNEDFSGNPLSVDGGAGFDQFIYSNTFIKTKGFLDIDLDYQAEIPLDYLTGIERVSLQTIVNMDITLSAADIRSVSGGDKLYIDRTEFGIEGYDISHDHDTVRLTDAATWVVVGVGVAGEDGTIYDMYGTLLDPLEPATFLLVEQGIDVAFL